MWARRGVRVEVEVEVEVGVRWEGRRERREVGEGARRDVGRMGVEKGLMKAAVCVDFMMEGWGRGWGPGMGMRVLLLLLY